MLAIASPAGAHGQEAVLPPPSYTETDCTDKVPIVVASDAPAQSDLYSAVTLAGVLDTRCVVLAGPRDEPMPEAQLARLEAAADGGFIVGGSAAVPDAKVADHALTRLAGTDRWHTARLAGAQALISAGGADTGTVEASAGAEDPTTDCTGDVAILVASDEAAQSDLYSAVTLAGVIGTDCIIVTGPRDADWPEDQRQRASVTGTGRALVGYVVGGLDAVPQEKFEGLSHSLTRIAGDDRWHTAQLVSTQARRIAQGEPTEATEEGTVTYTALSSGFEHSCALRSDGTAVCWGSNVEGKASPPEGTFTAVSAGGHHTCALRSDGTVACWGSDEFGQSSPPEGTFTAVSVGGQHTCGLRSDGTVACWGLDEDGQSTPNVGKFAAVSAGEFHTCGLAATNDMFFCWGLLTGSGSGDFAQLSAHLGPQVCVRHGDGTVTCWGAIYEGGGPARISIPQGAITAVSTGGRHACGIALGTVFCWGEDSHGQVTGGGEGNAHVVQNQNGDVVPFVALSAGGLHTCGLAEDGTIHCWGDNRGGRATPPMS
ncbi:RCC1 domain-containing protein [Candidatus Poriferisodalis sp.]|uniref:RCC1 domain-containing protein n=1 Tax=Candidatus Poriferisodalis sp. TaxID=3101277 RepID=UPI003B022DC8